MKYAAKRIATLVVTMVVVSFLAFVAFDLISGDPAEIMLGTQATPEALEALREELGLTILFIAHDLSVVKYFSERVAVMNRGRIVEMAASDMLYKNPVHPYTKSLLSAIPIPNPLLEKKRTRFAYDPAAHQYDQNSQPQMFEVEPGHLVLMSQKEYNAYLEGN